MRLHRHDWRLLNENTDHKRGSGKDWINLITTRRWYCTRCRTTQTTKEPKP